MFDLWFRFRLVVVSMGLVGFRGVCCVALRALWCCLGCQDLRVSLCW